MIVDLVIQIHPRSGVDSTDTPVEFLHFTNLPMERVKDAIDLLNDDHVELIPKPRTEDFTHDELFGRGFGERYEDYKSNTAEHEWYTRLLCKECGASVISPDLHLEFHNKLLP